MLVAFCLPTKVSCFLASLAFVFTNKIQTCEVCQRHLGLYFDLNSLEIPLGRKRRKFRELLLHSCLCRGKTSPEKGKKNETFLGAESLWKDSIIDFFFKLKVGFCFQIFVFQKCYHQSNQVQSSKKKK